MKPTTEKISSRLQLSANLPLTLQSHHKIPNSLQPALHSFIPQNLTLRSPVRPIHLQNQNIIPTLHTNLRMIRTHRRQFWFNMDHF